MNSLPPLELLESTHSFPGVYTFKAIGKVEEGFVARVLAAVRDALEMRTDCPFREHHTPNGRYVSVTLEPELQKAEQVLQVYEKLKDVPGLVMFM
ncbi:MAG: DUF493 domain-containing protein [Planctomycetales bacterium]